MDLTRFYTAIEAANQDNPTAAEFAFRQIQEGYLSTIAQKRPHESDDHAIARNLQYTGTAPGIVEVLAKTPVYTYVTGEDKDAQLVFGRGKKDGGEPYVTVSVFPSREMAEGYLERFGEKSFGETAKQIRIVRVLFGVISANFLETYLTQKSGKPFNKIDELMYSFFGNVDGEAASFLVPSIYVDMKISYQLERKLGYNPFPATELVVKKVTMIRPDGTKTVAFEADAE